MTSGSSPRTFNPWKGDLLFDLELSMLRHFLDHVAGGCAEETAEIKKKAEDGEYNEYEDYEAAFDRALFRHKYAVRLVYYELAAIIEREVQACASPAWQASRRHKGPKSLPEVLSLPHGSIESLKMISDLNFSDLLKLLKEYCQIDLGQLPQAESVLEVRDIVNSFKHRHGFKEFRRQNSGILRIGEQHRPSTQEARDAIERVSLFVKTLWKTVSAALEKRNGQF